MVKADDRAKFDFLLPIYTSKRNPILINKGAIMNMNNLYSGPAEYAPLINNIFACVEALNGTVQAANVRADFCSSIL